MKRVMVFFTLAMMITGMIVIFLGCGPPVVRVRPPEPRVEVYGSPPHPDAVWRPGHWAHRHGDWVWIPGHWERRPRPHAVWVPGHWEERRRGWVWIEGHWEYR